MTPQGGPSDRACSACGEMRPHHARGMCERCYGKWWSAENHDHKLAVMRAWRERNPGATTEAVRRYRSDPENRERDREASRRWKREHLGQPGKPKQPNALLRTFTETETGARDGR